jgi:transposase InsO family protein
MFRASENLLEKVQIKHAEQAFVTDITYIKIEQNHAYLALVTDAYSRKIMGWSFDNNMKVQMVKEALRMATKNRQFNHQTVIHHSDRGIQYCCPDYTEFAKKLNYKMSTTQNSDPYENAIAERINGILKYELGLIRTLPDMDTARKMIQQAVDIYNNTRLHWSLNLKTPSEVHRQFNRIKPISYKNQKNNS